MKPNHNICLMAQVTVIVLLPMTLLGCSQEATVSGDTKASDNSAVVNSSIPDKALETAAASVAGVSKDAALPNMAAPYTSDPFSMLQRFGQPKLTAKAQKYWDNFTPDMDPAIQCLPSTLARDMYSPAGILVEYLDNGDVRLSNETVFMDGRDFPSEYALEKRGDWPTSDIGYSIGSWNGDVLKVETRGVVERDILMGHIPILPSDQLIMKREFKLIDFDQRWEARGLAPEEVNYFMVSEEDGGRTLEMDIWLDDPVNLQETWHTVKHYREVNDASIVTTSGDIPIVASSAPKWEGTEAAANSGVPAEFLENYDGGCVLFPEYDELGEGTVGDFVPQ